jgi:hypothetical protein
MFPSFDDSLSTGMSFPFFVFAQTIFAPQARQVGSLFPITTFLSPLTEKRRPRGLVSKFHRVGRPDSVRSDRRFDSLPAREVFEARDRDRVAEPERRLNRRAALGCSIATQFRQIIASRSFVRKTPTFFPQIERSDRGVKIA